MTTLFSCSVIFILIAATLAAAKNTRCKGFDYLYHFGDGLTDKGNEVRINRTSYATFPPYGMSVPPFKPNGRWSDGCNDFDFASKDFGVPNISPYLKRNYTSDGVIFSVAGSPVLNHTFYKARGIEIPKSAVSLRKQLFWFKEYLYELHRRFNISIEERLANSLVLLGDIQGHDSGYALSQGKTIDEVAAYMPRVIDEQIEIVRELRKMGVKKLVIPGNLPLGCSPYILHARKTNNTSAYDKFGCLKDVNDFIKYRNKMLCKRVDKELKPECPDCYTTCADYASGVIRYLIKLYKDPATKGNIVKACCGVGGKYNYDPKRFCGPTTTVRNASQYMYWDGIHLTNQAQFKIEQDLTQSFIADFNCSGPVVPYYPCDYKG